MASRRVTATLSGVALAGCAALTGLDEYTFPSNPDGASSSTSDAVAPPPLLDGGVRADAADATAPTCAADASFTSDPRNCGACGHDCLGGACTADACQPFDLATGLNGPYAIASDGATLYVSLYDGKRIVSCPVTGCGASAATVVTTSDGASSIAVAGGVLYYALYTSGQLFACTLPGCSDAHRISQAGLAGSGPGAVYADTLLLPNYHAPPSNVVTCALPACATFSEVYHGDAPAGVAASDAWMFISEFSLGSILRCPRAGCGSTAETFASSQAGPSGVAMDGTRVYWANDTSGTVMACPIDGCGPGGPKTIASAETRALGVVVDERRIIWTTWMVPGAIRAIAK